MYKAGVKPQIRKYYRKGCLYKVCLCNSFCSVYFFCSVQFIILGIIVLINSWFFPNLNSTGRRVCVWGERRGVNSFSIVQTYARREERVLPLRTCANKGGRDEGAFKKRQFHASINIEWPQTFTIKIDNVVFLKEIFKVNSHLNKFYSKKEKNRWCEDLLALSLVSIIAYTDSFGEKFYYTNLKTIAWDDILLCKTF